MKTFLISLKIFLFFTVLTGIAYPLFVTGISGMLFPAKAGGSIVYRNNIKVGSALIGQRFDTTTYFSSRPSAVKYNPLPSGGSNYGLTSSKLKSSVDENADHFLTFNHLDKTAVIPSEMLFSSASGLDPHISLQSALLQENRVATARNFNGEQRQELSAIIKKHTEPPQFNLFGEKRINVLLLNLDLDKIK